MRKLLNIALATVCLAGTSLTALPATARETIGVHVGDLDFSTGRGHYYDRHHHRRDYSYPSDWRSYNHPRSWYHGHSQWNDRNHADWYRN